MDALQFRTYLVVPGIKAVDAWSRNAEELMMVTGAQESHLGHYVHQLGNGPAEGVLEMEDATHDSLWDNYIKYRPKLAQQLCGLAAHRWFGGAIPAEEMIGNLLYAIAMARVKYLDVKAPIPDYRDIPALAAYYKRYYNTGAGKATYQQVIDNYHNFVGNA